MRTRRDVLEELAVLGVAPDELPLDVDDAVEQTLGEKYGHDARFEFHADDLSENVSFDVEPVAVWTGDGHFPAADLQVGDPAANVTLSLNGEDALALAADLVSAIVEAEENPGDYSDAPEDA